MESEVIHLTGEASFIWSIVNSVTAKELTLSIDHPLGLSDREVLESTLRYLCAKADSFATPPKTVIAEIVFGEHYWGFLGARWRDGAYVFRNGLPAIGPPDGKVSVHIEDTKDHSPE